MKMNLAEVVLRSVRPRPWAEGEKIPWNDPEFSRRMLKEHLTQTHDAASRRTPTINKHVNWIHHSVLGGRPSHILDLGCGPGLYSSRLATLGHTCHGIDFSPASISYAKKHAGKKCSFSLADVRTAEFGQGYDLAMFIYGEFNVFTKPDARRILKKAYKSLLRGGKLLLEISTYDGVDQLGNQPATWYSSPNGLFSDKPHLCLMESFWDNAQHVAIERYMIVDADTGGVNRYASSTQAYDERAIKSLLRGVGFKRINIYPSLTGKDESGADEFQVIVAEK
jgi:SAM-dependent methyltransferase